MIKQILTFALSLGLATVALAHSGVKDPGVMARMEAMKGVGASSKVLRQMASGKQGFDTSAAEDAKAAIARHLTESEELFRLPHDDPKTEALPAIWQNYPDFVAKLRSAVAAVDALEVGSAEDLRATLPAAGQGCLDCHKLYRKE